MYKYSQHVIHRSHICAHTNAHCSMHRRARGRRSNRSASRRCWSDLRESNAPSHVSAMRRLPRPPAHSRLLLALSQAALKTAGLCYLSFAFTLHVKLYNCFRVHSVRLLITRRACFLRGQWLPLWRRQLTRQRRRWRASWPFPSAAPSTRLCAP